MSEEEVIENQKEEFLEFSEEYLTIVLKILSDRYEQFGDIDECVKKMEDVNSFISSTIICKSNRALSVVRKFQQNLEINEKRLDSFIDIVGYVCVWLWYIRKHMPDLIHESIKDYSECFLFEEEFKDEIYEI